MLYKFRKNEHCCIHNENFKNVNGKEKGKFKTIHERKMRYEFIIWKKNRLDKDIKRKVLYI